jgi:hypothetical protein
MQTLILFYYILSFLFVISCLLVCCLFYYLMVQNLLKGVGCVTGFLFNKQVYFRRLLFIDVIATF